MIIAGGITDPVAIPYVNSLGNAIATWMVSNTIVENIPPTMIAAGSGVSGFGNIDFTGGAGAGDSFGAAMAASIPAVDTPGIAKWKAIGNALVDHMKSKGFINPTTFVANPLGGAVTGTGLIAFTSMTFSPTIGSVVFPIFDTAGYASMASIGSTILTHIAANALVNSLGFTSPSGGGPLVGVSTIA